ncbi:hypothetical protein LCGC14_2347930, partial [marine sediment metagenome]
ITLLPQAVQVLGMSFHELVTNSAKYGAFQNESGRVALTWQLRDDSSLFVEWVEESGNTDEAPQLSTPPGFGSTVLTGFAQSMLDGRASFEMEAGTLRWSLSIPAEHFQPTART